MKGLKEIEKLTELDLERIAQDESIEVPATLKHDISVKARALEMTSHKRIAMFSYPAAAVAVIAIGMSLTFHSTPKDTYDDPYMAYAQIEEIFEYISDKINVGMDIVNTAQPIIEKTINVLK